MQFQVTFDYLCPFARNLSEAALDGVAAGRDWQPWFRPFSLSQVHVPEGEPAVWEADHPEAVSGVPALLWGIAVRDHCPERFPAVHRALFAARHDRGEDLRDPAAVRAAVQAAGADAEEIARIVAGGGPLRTLAAEHTEAVEQWAVFGVPTILMGGEAVYLRLMERGRDDDLQRVLEMVEWTRLNEFKRTRIPR
jgi:hypothetical protein